jgi:hypothetical protein
LAWAILVVGCAAGALAGAAEKSSKSTLEDLLKRLRYDPVKFIANDENFPFVDAAIPPDRKLRLIVDTGCSLTTFDESRTKGLKRLGEDGLTREDEVLGALTNLPFAMMERFVIGRTLLVEQPVVMRDVAPAHGRWSNDGILGADFFHRNYCLIDCGTRQLYVRTNQPSQQEANALAQSLRMSGYAEAPITWEFNPIVEASINDLPVRLLVDTGAFASVIDDSQVKRLGLRTVRDDRPAPGSLIQPDLQGRARVGIKGDVVEFKVSRLKTLQIGEKSWKSFPFAVQDLSTLRMGRPGTKRPDVKGLLGRDILMGYGALIDFGNRKVWFPPEKKTKP